MMINRTIGEKFQYENRNLTVYKSGKCKLCFFFGKDCFQNKIKELTGSCSGIFRPDKTDVIFTQLKNIIFK